MLQVGQVLDKYELLERVGQGGMAIVYRGIDRSLKRVVAIKVLHKHLADYQEARDRFEREAQAVASLRHENILEIFDFSAKPDSEAYIVTEFIDGQTLKQVVTTRPIAFPEIGAMLVVQVGRALAHAHAGGILHRDVKPENIMIRGDGIVKLMDFGISHMVDLERLTVTGQLLGSPAYMAPEHVEGRPLDYRTDVFAAGIVLYQLCVGKLPFEGKNPHEVLKRIAECRFIDPRTANPRIGNRLGRIILRAMAREPADRYAAIGEMVTAIESYLDESGIDADKVPAELARYFASPITYEGELEARLVDHLTKRGQRQLAADDRAGALDAFDRVLTIDKDNAKVIAILDGINRRARWRTVGLAVAVIGVISGGAFLIHKKTEPPPPEAPPSPDHPTVERTQPISVVVADDRPPPLLLDAAVAVVAPEPDAAGPAIGVRPTSFADAAVATEPATPSFEVTVHVYPERGAKIDFGQGFEAVEANGLLTRTLTRETKIKATNTSGCCAEKEQIIQIGQARADITLEFLAAQITPTCSDPNAAVTINRRPATLGVGTPVPFENTTNESLRVQVEFVTVKDARRIEKAITVTPGKSFEVACE